MELNKDSFDDFTKRLRHHNEGEGVDWHLTANPLFIVQCLRRVCGIDFDYDPDYYWTDNDNEIELTDEELKQALSEYTENGGAHDEFDIDYDKFVTVGEDILYQKIGYHEYWDYVNAHFTKEAAEAFIKRKAHDYRQLRICVDSQYWCPEFNSIVKGLLGGQIQFVDKKGE